MRLRSTLVSLSLLSLAAVGAGLLAPRPAEARLLAELDGKVFGYDPDSAQLNITTRTGPKILLVTSRTQVFVNGRSSAIGSVVVGDRVDVTYNYVNSNVVEIFVTRERRRSGTIVSATANSISFRLDSGGQLSMQVDSLSSLDVGGLAVTDPRPLAGLPARVVYQSGTNNLVLSLAATAKSLRGTLNTVDTTAEQLGFTSTDGKSRTFTLDSFVSLRRNGTTAELSEFTAGDRVTVVFVKQGTAFRALAVQGRSVTASKG